jgi:hypothetical protein
MNLPVLSASRSDLLACELATRLPWDEAPAGPAAQVGTRFHELVEGAIKAREWVPLDPLDAAFEVPLRAALEWFTSTAAPDSGEVLLEQAYELKPLGGYTHEPGRREPHWRDTMTCTVLPKRGHREYPRDPSAFYGTADVVLLDGRGGAHVCDWKTGRRSDGHRAQLLSLALMVAEAHKVDRVQATAVYVDLKTGKVKTESFVVDSFDLHVHAGLLVRIFKSRVVAGAMPDPVPGKYCFFCPAVGCPEKLRK